MLVLVLVRAVCKYTVHQRCAQLAPASCITTYTNSRKPNQVLSSISSFSFCCSPAFCSWPPAKQCPAVLLALLAFGQQFLLTIRTGWILAY